MDPAPRQCTFDADELSEHLTCIVPGNEADVRAVIDGIMRIVGGMECARGKEDDVRRSLEEAVANAVTRDPGTGPRPSVEVRVECDPDRGMLVIVRTAGSPFGPRTWNEPVLARNLYAEHGRGIYLIDELMDEVTLDETGTEIRMLKK